MYSGKASMSVTKPPSRRPSPPPRRPSRIKIAAIWFALLLGSFLFGMLIISPLLGAILSGSDKGNGRPDAGKNPAPAPKPARSRTSSLQPGLTVEENLAPRRDGAGISLSPDDSESRVQAADKVEFPVVPSG